MWLRARGAFMVIDNLAFNRGEVVAPWQENRALANNFFKINFVVTLLLWTVLIGSFVAAGFIAWPDLNNHVFGTGIIWALILLAVVWPLAVVNFGIFEMLMFDFIAPTMYLHDLPTGRAWKRWARDILKGHFWKLTLFYLMKLVLGIASGIVATMAVCLTCCIAALPYIGTVILLPVFVFMRCYTLCYIEQFGEPWRVFVGEEGEVPCIGCGYDLRGNPDATHCPECGEPTPFTLPPDGGGLPGTA